MRNLKSSSIFKFATLAIVAALSLSAFARQAQNAISVGEYFSYSEKGQTVVRQVVGHITTPKQDVFYLNNGETVSVDDFYAKAPNDLSCERVTDQYFVRAFIDKELPKPQMSVRTVSCRLIDSNDHLAGLQLVDGTIVSVGEMKGTRTLPSAILAPYLKQNEKSHSVFLDAGASEAIAEDCSHWLIH